MRQRLPNRLANRFRGGSHDSRPFRQGLVVLDSGVKPSIATVNESSRCDCHALPEFAIGPVRLLPIQFRSSSRRPRLAQSPASRLGSAVTQPFSPLPEKAVLGNPRLALDPLLVPASLPQGMRSQIGRGRPLHHGSGSCQLNQPAPPEEGHLRQAKRAPAAPALVLPPQALVRGSLRAV